MVSKLSNDLSFFTKNLLGISIVLFKTIKLYSYLESKFGLLYVAKNMSNHHRLFIF